MTSNLNHWLNGMPVIPLGDPDFAGWSNGAPFVDLGESGGGPGVYAGSRIISPRREKRNTFDFTGDPWRMRLVTPRIETARSPST